MIVKEQYAVRDDGVVLERTHSDQGMMIRQSETGRLYSEAIDNSDSVFTYRETDIPIDTDIEITLSDTLMMLRELGVDTDD